MPPCIQFFQSLLYNWAKRLSTTVGNANLASDSLGLNAQKTVSYEIGLWQELSKNTSFEVNLLLQRHL